MGSWFLSSDSMCNKVKYQFVIEQYSFVMCVSAPSHSLSIRIEKSGIKRNHSIKRLLNDALVKFVLSFIVFY